MKKLTGREIQVLCTAIDTVEEKDPKYYEALKDEWTEIRDKLTYEVTKNGNRIKRGFSMAGCDGSELNIFGKLRDNGYKELYYDAPYSWGVVNIEEMKIFTYCEGDTSHVECKSKKTFQAELMDYWNFQMENAPRTLDGDSVETMKKAGLKVYWRDVKEARKND